jgi:hypothetical protein
VIYPQRCFRESKGEKSLYIKKMPKACWNVQTAGATKVGIERVWNMLKPILKVLTKRE